MEVKNIEEIIKPFYINELNEKTNEIIYSFLDKYYNKEKEYSNNIKTEFLEYQKTLHNKDLFKFGYLIYYYHLGRINNRYSISDKNLEKNLKINNVRENSGVIVSTIFTSAFPKYKKIYNQSFDKKEIIVEDKPFSCGNDCFYCPNVPGHPRSYYPGEPGVDRAIQNDYDAIKQSRARARQYIQQGHPIDKFEIIIKGGTWDYYSREYRDEFIRDIYYAHNTMIEYIFGKEIRKEKSLEEEIKINETANCRIIGVTIETRPDHVNYVSLKLMRSYGITRVELGIQHLDDIILKYINRGCYKKHSIRAIKLLKDNCFKVDGHIMLDLPAPFGYENIMPELDRIMLNQINTNPDFKMDQIKIYPCMTTPFTKIKEWYETGIYLPYGEDKKMNEQEKLEYKRLTPEKRHEYRMKNLLYKNIYNFYENIHPSIRVNRIIRDLPGKVLVGGIKRLGLRAELEKDLEILQSRSGCIRYREAGNHRNKNRLEDKEPILKVLNFESSVGEEYFLSYETEEKNPILFSFLRLRLSKNSGKTDYGKIVFPELIDTALIREVHTYGKVIPCKENTKLYENNNKILFSHNADKIVQHKGYGKKLIKKAEEIAIKNGYTKIAVIAGVGVRNYYRKLGFTEDSDEGYYQIKKLSSNNKTYILLLIYEILTLFIFIGISFYQLFLYYNNYV